MSTDRRTHIAKEILSTERTFVKNLKTIVDVFLLPLRLAIDDGRTIIKQRNIEQIFSNIEEIMGVSVKFLFLIEQRVETWNDKPCIGDVFMEVIPDFGVYDKYLMDHHRAIMKVTELEKRGPFAQFLVTALQRPECDNLDVLALLITPVQRILRYKLFLEDLIKCTPNTHADYKNLELALAAVLEKAAAVNESIKVAENYEKLCQIQKSFIGSVKNLVEEDRLFIREGSLTKVCRKIPKKRWFFLFSDVVIYASLVAQSGGGNMYLFHRMVQLSKTRVKTVVDTDTQKNAFQIITNDKSFTVFSDTPEEKELWLQDFNKATSSKAASDAVDTSKEDNSAPVWVPDNNGVICRMCSGAFTWVNRRHHCRQCGNLVCGACSTGRAVLPHSTDGKPLRVCDECQPPPVTPVTVGVSGVAISAPTFSHGTSEHAVVSQIMRNTAGLTNSLSSSALTRTPSRMGIKPPSNPLPLTPLQMATGQSPTSPISPTSLKTTKPIPPVPAASLKRSNTVGVVSYASTDPVPPLPPKHTPGAPRVTGAIPPQPAGLAPTPGDEAAQRGAPSPRIAQEHPPAPQGAGSEEHTFEAEVQILLTNLQKMLKTEAQTSHLSPIERVRFFSSKINEHNLKYNTPPSGPPPSPLSSLSASSNPNTTIRPKPAAAAAVPSGTHGNVNPRGSMMRPSASVGDLPDHTSTAAFAQAPARPGNNPTATSSPSPNGTSTKPAAVAKTNVAPSLPVIPPRKAATTTMNKPSPRASTIASPILVDTSRT